MPSTTQEQATRSPQVSVILGGIGTACWCIQILPQIWKNWRRHTTTGVPGHMLLLWASAMPFFGAYCIVQGNNLAIQTQPQIFCLLCLLCWSQTLYYANKFRPWQAVLIALATAAGFAAVEIALVFGVRIPYSDGTHWPLTVLGAWACALISFGLILPYYEAYKAGWRFIGLSFRFIAIDFAGALFSLVSLATQHKWDKFGGATYIIVMILEIGLVVIQLRWIWLNRMTIRAARAEGKTFDEYIAVKETKQKMHDEEVVVAVDDPGKSSTQSGKNIVVTLAVHPSTEHAEKTEPDNPSLTKGCSGKQELP